MKKKWIVTALAACAIALAGCKIVSEPEPIAVQSVILSETTLTLTIEDDWTRTLVATVYPYNADNRTVTWYSSNPDVADVDSWGGVVTAHSEGTTTISAYAGSCMATCEVTVKRRPVAVSYFMLDERLITLEPGARRILVATVYPEDADDKTVIWSSSNPEVATVENNGMSDGMITAISPGEAIITAQAVGNGDTVQCLVTVSETAVEQPGFPVPVPVPVPVESITLNTYKLILEPNTTSTLTADVMPPDADNKTVIWSTSDYWVATVDYYDGTVTAHNAGTATITAWADGKTAECEVTVRHISNPVTGVTLDKTGLTLTRDEEYTLTATVTPSNADYKSVTWTSSDYEVADLDYDFWNNGTCTVKAVKAGTATITVTTEEGGFTATCEVTVLPISIDSITFLGTTLLVVCDETGYLDYKITPDDADEGTLIWSSSDEAIATVNEWGWVTGHKVGTATITATAKVGGKTATYEVKVHKHSYRDGKCTECGANPTMKDGKIDKNGVLTEYSGSDTTLIIPEGVTGIGDRVLYLNSHKKYITSVTIPDSVTSIGIVAFSDCTSLTNVVIPDSVTSIGNSAFSGCTSLTNVVIPDSVTSIGNSVFRGCTSLTNVVIPDSVTKIGNYTFYECTGLTEVKIPDSVTSIGNEAFANCTKLTSVTIPPSVTSIGSGAFSECTNLTSVTILSNVTSIEANTFYKCRKLTSVTIPSSITNVGNSAFYGCENLTTVAYGGTLADWCSITWNDDVEPYTYSANPLTNENAVLYIDKKEVKNAVIPNNVKEIKYHAFYKYTSLESVTISDGVTSIGMHAFRECSNLTSVTIPGSVTSIGDWAFHWCRKLESVTIDEGVTSIGYEAFSFCFNLTSVSIPASVTNIEHGAFRACDTLTTVTYAGTRNDWNDKIIKGDNIFTSNPLITGKGGIWTYQ